MENFERAKENGINSKENDQKQVEGWRIEGFTTESAL